MLLYLLLFTFLFLISVIFLYHYQHKYSTEHTNIQYLDKEKLNNNLNYKDIKLLILNCKKYSHKRKNQLNSWIKYLPKDMDYYHIIYHRVYSTNFNCKKTTKLYF